MKSSGVPASYSADGTLGSTDGPGYGEKLVNVFCLIFSPTLLAELSWGFSENTVCGSLKMLISYLMVHTLYHQPSVFTCV